MSPSSTKLTCPNESKVNGPWATWLGKIFRLFFFGPVWSSSPPLSTTSSLVVGCLLPARLLGFAFVFPVSLTSLGALDPFFVALGLSMISTSSSMALRFLGGAEASFVTSPSSISIGFDFGRRRFVGPELPSWASTFSSDISTSLSSGTAVF